MNYNGHDYSLMGIINLTDNSFMASSRMAGKSIDEVLSRVSFMASNGAEYIDVGACSTAPGVEEVPMELELKRLDTVLPVLISHFPSLKFSVDTFRPEVVKALAVHSLPFIINDVRTADENSGMVELSVALGLDYIAMDSSADPYAFFEKFSERAEKAGLKNWILDPGFGFGKTIEQNLAILENLNSLRDFGRPVLAALSHKRMIFMPAGLTPATCTRQSVEAELKSVMLGADIVRTHDTDLHKAACSAAL